MPTISAVESITIRLATAGDHNRLVVLTQRNSRVVPTGPLLIPESERSIREARALESGRLIADPVCVHGRARRPPPSARRGSAILERIDTWMTRAQLLSCTSSARLR